MTDSFFTIKDQWFIPTDHTRGPWHPEHCHAGPPTGIVARSLEALFPDQMLVRLTVNLLRPIPFSGFRTQTDTIKSGRQVSLGRSCLLDRDGRTCATAESLHIKAQTAYPYPSVEMTVPLPGDGVAGDFPIRRTLHNQPSFAGPGVETRYPADEGPEPGPTTAWIKTVPLLPDEQPSPFQKICPMADCGNAFSRNAEPWDVTFMNPDLTIALFREPVGDWLGSRSVGHWAETGIGLADATLLDETGIVGRAVQTLLLKPASSNA